MANIDEILIELRIDAGDTAKSLVDVQTKIDDVRSSSRALKNEQKELSAEIKNSGQATAEQSRRMAEISSALAGNAANLKQLTAEEKMYTAQLNLATQGDRKFGDSLIEMSAELAQLKQEYRGLSAAQREGAAGKELQQSIANLDKALKDADATLGDHQRNVGNYQSALLGLNGNVGEVAQMFSGGFVAGLKNAGVALKGFAKTLLATPIGWISAAVGVLIGAFNMLKKGFDNNDEASTKMAAAMAQLRPIIDGVVKVFSSLAGVVAKVAGVVIGVATTLISKVSPAFKEASEKAAAYEYQMDALEEKERQYTVASSERAVEIARLKKEERGNEQLTAEQREEMLKKVEALELKDLEERKQILKEKYEAAKYEMERTGSTNDELANKVAEARAAMNNAEAEYLTATTRVAARAAAAREEEAKAQEEAKKKAVEAWKERKRQLKEQRDVEVAELRKLEELQIDAITDIQEQARVRTSREFDVQIEDLKNRLKEEKNLTATARAAINGQITALEDAKYKALIKLDEEFREEQKRQEEEEKKRIEDEAAARAAAAAQAEAQRLEAIRAQWDEDFKRVTNDYADKVNEFYGNAVRLSEVALEQALEHNSALVSMDAETRRVLFATEEDYMAAVIQSEAEIRKAREQNEQALQAQAEEVASTMHAVTGAMGDMFEAVAGDSEAYEKFRKAMAIVDAMISMAQTIAAATTASATEGDPYTMAIRIAANVAAVTAQFAAVIKAIKGAQIPSAGSYAEGGIVPGRSYSGDRLRAAVNSREMVLTLNQQQRLFDLIRAGAPSPGGNYEMMASVMKEVLRDLPAPQLVYREFKDFERRVKMNENKLK